VIGGSAGSELNTDDLRERVEAVCTAAVRALDPGDPATAAIVAVSERLAEPTLRIAVGGRLNAGKSTLVNALLGQRLAPTGATECTKVVTWFRYHHQAGLEVTPRSGSAYPLALAAGGRIPADLGRPAADIASVTLRTPNRRLSRHILADTPGLDSLTGLDDLSLAALRDCDALVFVMPHPGGREREALDSLRTSVAAIGLSVANTVGVLSRIDQLGAGDVDPWPAARRVAGRYAAQLRSSVIDVVPVMGLLAETATGEEFTEADAAALATIAAATPVVERRMLLLSTDEFVADPSVPVDAPARRRLVDMLGLYGIEQALSMVDDGITGADALLARLGDRSGLGPLRDIIEHRFAPGADVLRAAGAMAALDRMAWTTGGSPGSRRAAELLRTGLGELRGHPALRLVALTTAIAGLDDADLPLDDDARSDLDLLLRGRTDAERVGQPDAPARDVAAAADVRIRRWRGITAYQPAANRCIRMAREAFESIYYAATARR
jgi:hypothetical protein